MAIKIKHYGHVTPEGKVIFNSPELFENQKFALRGFDFELTMDKRIRKASPSKFAYLFCGILPTIMSTEAFSHYLDPEELFYDVFAPLLLSYKVQITTNGKSHYKTREKRLSDLNDEELGELITKMKQWCMEENIVILDADQYQTRNYRTIKKDK